MKSSLAGIENTYLDKSEKKIKSGATPLSTGHDGYLLATTTQAVIQ